jgi:large subunit ribosomal protein L30
MATAATIFVKRVHSGIGFDRTQKDTLRGLGLRRQNKVVELKDTPAIRGMIYKVRHLVRVIDAQEAKAAAKPSPWKGVIIVPGPKQEPKPAKKAAKAEKSKGKKKSKPAKKGT